MPRASSVVRNRAGLAYPPGFDQRVEGEGVTDHHIRLRGGWELIDLDQSGSSPVRVTLPLGSGGPHRRRVRLTRKFGRPPVDARTESIGLSLDHVPGLRGASLNGRPLAIQLPLVGGVEVAVDLPERSELVLEADLPADPPAGPPWGEVALLIRRSATTAGEPALGFGPPRG
jgi:hypothetical protein